MTLVCLIKFLSFELKEECSLLPLIHKAAIRIKKNSLVIGRPAQTRRFPQNLLHYHTATERYFHWSDDISLFCTLSDRFKSAFFVNVCKNKIDLYRQGVRDVQYTVYKE